MMRPTRVRLTVRRAMVAATLAAVLLAVCVGSLMRRQDEGSRTAARRPQEEARTSSDGRSAIPTIAVVGADASALGERRAVEVEGKALIVDSYAAFPALGDIDGGGLPDLLLGNPHGFLKVYRNVGEPGRPRLAAPVPFGRFCDDERIPTG
jgi:hypothetical protein